MAVYTLNIFVMVTPTVQMGVMSKIAIATPCTPAHQTSLILVLLTMILRNVLRFTIFAMAGQYVLMLTKTVSATKNVRLTALGKFCVLILYHSKKFGSLEIYKNFQSYA